MTAPVIHQPDAPSAAFFAGLGDGRILLQRCRACGMVLLGVRQCVSCGATEFDAVEASGAAAIVTFTRIHIAYHPHFRDHVPYDAGVVRLAEGPGIYCRIDAGGAPLSIGDRGHVAIVDLGEGQCGLQFNRQ